MGKKDELYSLPKILMQPIFLPPVSHRLADGAPQYLDRFQRGQHRLCTKRLDERDDLNDPARSRPPGRIVRP